MVGRLTEGVMKSDTRSILITGASSGIGGALAYVYAGHGVRLALTGRDPERLAEISDRCRAKGAEVVAACLDVRDRRKMSKWILSTDDGDPIDLLIASAGINSGLGMGRLREDPSAVRAVISTNLFGMLNSVDPIVDRMCARGCGHIALIGSIAGVRGLPYSPAYCAAKAAVHCYAEALGASLFRQGVYVSLIVPGFVETAMSRKIVSPKPLQMSHVRAANIIRRGLDRHASVIAFPRLLYHGAFLTRLLPKHWIDFALSRIQVDIPETQERADD
jgi:NADP-dependent 3-hydroxy acid dehydrogenase YdfG